MFVIIIVFKCWWLVEGPATQVFYSCKHAKLTATFQPSVGCSPTLPHYILLTFAFSLRSNFSFTSPEKTLLISQSTTAPPECLSSHPLLISLHSLCHYLLSLVRLFVTAPSQNVNALRADLLLVSFTTEFLVSSTVPDIW